MKIEITKREQELLHNAMILYIEKVVQTTRTISDMGIFQPNDPIIEIRKLHSKIISAND